MRENKSYGMNTKSNLFQELSEDMRVSSVNRHLLVSYEAKLINARNICVFDLSADSIPCSKVLYYCLLDSSWGMENTMIENYMKII